MAKIHGITETQLIPGPDFSARQNENGGWTATQSFKCVRGGFDKTINQSRLARGTRLTTLDPDADRIFSFLALTRILAVDSVEGGYTKIACEFSGFTSNSFLDDPEIPDPIPTYYKRGALVEAPLDEHPIWKALSDTEKFALGLLIKGDAVAKPDFTGVGTYNDSGTWSAWEDGSGPIVLTGDAIEFAKRIAQGKSTYKLGTYEYTHRWEASTGISASQMNDLGKISVPSGSPPKPGAGRNWMLVGANEEQHGSGDFRFSNELVYLLSDEGGHDSFLQS